MQSRWRLVSGHQILFHETEEGINSLQRVLGGNIAVYMDGIGYVEPSRVGHSPSEAEKRDLEVCELSCKFVQEGNTLGTTEITEELEIKCEYQLTEAGNGGDCFVTIKTDTGWSAEDSSEIKNMIDRVVGAADSISKGKRLSIAP
ncbi:MAG: hypothetical protein CMK32_10235 [Porticoccaceae bacterium]|nr:hypothetical protein [Porticoccaceae bacterium]